MFTLAHLSDIHLAPLPAPRLRDLSVKRLTGYVNWHRRRKRMHQRAVLESLIADVRNERPDHVAVTGDLVNIGLPDEFADALRWLHTVGTPSEVTVVPGNHDAYVRLLRDTGYHQWQPYMSANAEGSRWTPAVAAEFPFVRCFGRYALIGLNTAVPTPPFVASGRLGSGQREALSGLLRALRQEGLCRIVLLHHPPLPGLAKTYRDLTDAPQLEAILKAEGAELVLYGHNHKQLVNFLDGPGGRLPLVGVPSASAAWPEHAPPARYNLFRIEPAGGGWRIEMIGRELAHEGGPIREAERVTLRA